MADTPKWARSYGERESYEITFPGGWDILVHHVFREEGWFFSCSELRFSRQPLRDVTEIGAAQREALRRCRARVRRWADELDSSLKGEHDGS